MCDICEKHVPIFSQTMISESAWGWGNDDVKLSLSEALECEDIQIVFIDRGYIRMVSKDDQCCMDHGEKMEIHFCPFCGRNLSGGVEQLLQPDSTQ